MTMEGIVGPSLILLIICCAIISDDDDDDQQQVSLLRRIFGPIAADGKPIKKDEIEAEQEERKPTLLAKMPKKLDGTPMKMERRNEEVKIKRENDEMKQREVKIKRENDEMKQREVKIKRENDEMKQREVKIKKENDDEAIGDAFADQKPEGRRSGDQRQGKARKRTRSDSNSYQEYKASSSSADWEVGNDSRNASSFSTPFSFTDQQSVEEGDEAEEEESDQDNNDYGDDDGDAYAKIGAGAKRKRKRNLNSADKMKEIIEQFDQIKRALKAKWGAKIGHNEWMAFETKIARKLGSSRRTIYKWKKDLGLTKRRGKSDFKKLKIVQKFERLKRKVPKRTAFSQKQTGEKIAAQQLGYSAGTIKRWKAEFGLTRPKKFGDDEKIEIVNAYNAIIRRHPRMRMVDIANVLGIGPRTLATWRQQFAKQTAAAAQNSARVPSPNGSVWTWNLATKQRTPRAL